MIIGVMITTKLRKRQQPAAPGQIEITIAYFLRCKLYYYYYYKTYRVSIYNTNSCLSRSGSSKYFIINVSTRQDVNDIIIILYYILLRATDIVFQYIIVIFWTLITGARGVGGVADAISVGGGNKGQWSGRVAQCKLSAIQYNIK